MYDQYKSTMMQWYNNLSLQWFWTMSRMKFLQTLRLQTIRAPSRSSRDAIDGAEDFIFWYHNTIWLSRCTRDWRVWTLWGCFSWSAFWRYHCSCQLDCHPSRLVSQCFYNKISLLQLAATLQAYDLCGIRLTSSSVPLTLILFLTMASRMEASFFLQLSLEVLGVRLRIFLERQWGGVTVWSFNEGRACNTMFYVTDPWKVDWHGW